MSSKSIRLAAPLLPYIAVGTGFYLVHNAWAALLGYHIGIIALLTLTHSWPVKHQIKLPANRLWLIPGLSGTTSGVLLFFLWNIAVSSSNPATKLVSLGLNSTTWLLFIVYFSLVNPWLEEYYWRGWLGNPSSSLLLRDIWFGGYHLLVLAPFIAPGWLVFALVFMSMAGWLLRQIAARSGSLFSAILLHFTADLSIILAVYFRVG